MQLALNFGYERMTLDNFKFAKQAGCHGIIGHLNSYSQAWSGGTDTKVQMKANDSRWELDSLLRIKKKINNESLELYGIENFNPFDWCDILQDGPKKRQQLDNVKRIIQNVGKSGIPAIGYNFSLTGVYGRRLKPLARGGAETMCFSYDESQNSLPIPNGEIWNTLVDDNAPKGNIPIITNEELWQRLEGFLQEVVPVAEEVGVILAAHPDDPPVQRLRGNARLVNSHEGFQRLIDIVDSPSNGIQLCIGTMQEMTGGEVYPYIKKYSAQNRIAYTHLRNVRGKVPNYIETLIDDGDLDIFKVIKSLKEGGFNGPIVPDHTPHLLCNASWHAGMAFQLGYLKAVLTSSGCLNND